MAVFNVREIAFGAESSFAENAGSLSSNTWDKRIPATSVNFSLEQTRGNDGSINNRANETRPGYRSPRSATVEITMPWAGYGAVTNGSLTQTWQQDLLSDALGGGNTAQVGGTVDTSSTATSLEYAGGETVVAGGIVRVGALGDARGGGSAAVVNAVGAPATLFTALPANPNNGDALYATQIAYPDESVDAGTLTKRWLLGWNSTTDSGAQWHVVGCQASAISVDIPLDGSGTPTMTLTYRGAYWGRSATTVPSALTLENCDTAVATSGKLWYQDVGTTTHNTLNPSRLSLTVELDLFDKTGPGSGTQQPFQRINGYVRGRCIPTLVMTVPWATAYETLFDTDGSGTTHKHILYQSGTTDGRIVGFYMPRAFITGARPTFTDSNGILYAEVTFVGREGTTTTNALTRSAIRFFSG